MLDIYYNRKPFKIHRRAPFFFNKNSKLLNVDDFFFLKYSSYTTQYKLKRKKHVVYER